MKFLKSLFFLCLLFSSAILNAQITKEDAPDSVVFKNVETEADFPGGVEAWKKYLVKNLRADVSGENGAPDGLYTVVVEFVVDKIGAISAIKALTNHGYGMEQEVVRIIKNSGSWIPAQQKGRMVKAYRKQPVSFIVQTDGFEIITKTPYTLYTSVPNEIEIRITDVKPNDITATISKGTIIKNGDGRFTARINQPGRVIIEAFNKKNKSQGRMSIEVKHIPAADAK